MGGFTNKNGQSIVYADNVDFSGAQFPSNTVTLDGELLIGGAAAPHLAPARLTAGPGVSITNAQNSITIGLSGAGQAIDSVAVQTGTSPVLPDGNGNITLNGSVVSAGTNPIRSNGTGVNTIALEVQISQALAVTDATKIGLANFDSAAFDVDPNGFVQLNGGGIAATSFDVQANTAPGTDPVVPSASGVVVVNGAAVANHSVVLETRSRAANAYNLEIQYATTSVATDATKSGVAHFDSAKFTVDSNGFVSASGTGLGQTITGNSGGALSPTSGNWNVFGLSGSKTSGSGSTLTVKSPPYADAGASATSALNTGEFVTGAYTRTLPASAGLADGDLIEYVCTTASALVIQAVGAQKIRFGRLLSSVAGTLTSTQIGDSVSLRFRATDDFWYVTASIGTWVVA